ncbi:hypothetical protein Tco_0685437 [Tanacetum coccineum]
MEKLAFCDYHNMVAILEKTEHNVDFHQIVDFLEASHIRYALMVSPTVYVSYIRQFWSTTRVETVDGETNIIAKVNGKQRTVSESLIRRHLKLNDEEGISTFLENELFENLSLIVFKSKKRLTRGTTWISQSKVPSPGANETASRTRDDRHGEAFPTATSLDAGQDRENIAKTSAMPHESSPRVTSLGGGEGKQRIQSQDLEITQLKNRFKTLEDNEKRSKGFAQEDAPNTRGMDQGEDLILIDTETNNEKSTKKGSDNTDEMANVLSTLVVANVLSSGGTSSTPAGVDTASGSFPTAAIFTTASVTTPYTRRTRASRGIIIESSQTTSVPIINAKGKGKEKMVESKSTKKKKVQEQLDAHVAKELEYEFAREEQLIREQGEKDAKIARDQTERELGIMIAELDRSNELIAKYMNEYEQAEADFSLEEKMELITELIKYQRNLAKIKRLKKNSFQSGNMQNFVPMNSKLESKRIKRPGIQLVQKSFKKLKTTKASGSEPSQEQQTKYPKELSKEELKKMMEIIPVEEFYIEALQAKYPIIDWEIYSEEQRKYWKIIRVGNHTEVYQIFEEMLKRFDREDMDRLWSLVKKTFSTTDPTEDKEKELWVELKRIYEPDPRDQLCALQKYMHDPLECMLYDTCSVHHVSTRRGREIFMLVEKDYPLKKGLTTMMLCNKLQVDQYSKMANELLRKIYSIANSPR